MTRCSGNALASAVCALALVLLPASVHSSIYDSTTLSCTDGGGGPDSTVNAVDSNGASKFYFVGDFLNVPTGTPVTRAAAFDLSTSSWSALGSGLNGVASAVKYEAVRGVVYIGGSFSGSGSNVVQVDATTNAESSLQVGGSASEGCDNFILALAAYPDGNVRCTFEPAGTRVWQ